MLALDVATSMALLVSRAGATEPGYLGWGRLCCESGPPWALLCPVAPSAVGWWPMGLAEVEEGVAAWAWTQLHLHMVLLLCLQYGSSSQC